MRDVTWDIRPASHSDAHEVHEAVTELLRELAGDPDRELVDFAPVFTHLTNNPTAGGVLVARATDGPLLGVLTYSRQSALRTGGAYLLIQELWVDAAARGLGVGRALVDALWKHAGDDITDLEVGLPSDSFSGVERTTRFYELCGFTVIGLRARARRD